MSTLLRMELSKLFRLASVRFGLALIVVFPLLWAYAPGIFEVYGFFLVSGFQVPALSLLSSDGLRRLRICPNCNWLFVDRSRNDSRLWCDMAVCGNRQKAKRHYRRRKAEEVSHA